MSEDTRIDLHSLDWRSMTPTEWSALKNRLIEQARRKRNAELRKAMAHVFAWPERLRGAVVRAFVRKWRALAIARRRRAAYVALSALDDRALRDIGLRRGEIFAAVYRPRAGRRR